MAARTPSPLPNLPSQSAFDRAAPAPTPAAASTFTDSRASGPGCRLRRKSHSIARPRSSMTVYASGTTHKVKIVANANPRRRT